MMNKGINGNSLKNALVLAYLGDAVYSLMVREFLVNNHGEKANGLNKLANSVVCARFQAEVMTRIKDELNEEELAVVMRARNSHINSKAKNSTLAEYSLATELEALIGFWYLNKEEDKLKSLFDRFVKEKLC